MKNRTTNQSIPFKCPKGNFSCPYVNTMTYTLDVDCKTCNHHEKQN